MKYGQGFGSMASIFVICLIGVALIYVVLRCFQRLDKEAVNIRKCNLTTQVCLCIISGEVVCLFFKIQQEVMELSVAVQWLLLSAVAACLLAACIMDMECYMIYNYVWWLGGAGATMLLCLGDKRALWELVIYVLLQEVLFSKMYGRADCHAFVVCAILETSWGMNMQGYLTHMLFAFLLLAVVQGSVCNIGKDGNLKQPIAFLPYITVSFWVIVLMDAVLS